MLFRSNQIALIEGPQGIFCVGAGNDGSLPVLMVGGPDDEERKGMLAIEPVDGAVAREERFKCIQAIWDYHIVTANSAGVVSLMNLKGAVNMIVNGEDRENINDESASADTYQSNSDDENQEEAAVEIVESVQLGSGARITCLTAWFTDNAEQAETECIDTTPLDEAEVVSKEKIVHVDHREDKRKAHEIEMDSAAVEKARALVHQAKKIQKKKKAKKQKTQ